MKQKSFYSSFCFHKNVQDGVPDERTDTLKENLFIFVYIFSKSMLTFHFEITFFLQILFCFFPLKTLGNNKKKV